MTVRPGNQGLINDHPWNARCRRMLVRFRRSFSSPAGAKEYVMSPQPQSLATRPRFPVVAFVVSWWLVSGALLANEIKPAKDAPQPLSPRQSAARMQFPPGFRLELVASEPLIQDPSCIAFDERGRLFVSELHGYNLEGHLDVVELNQAGRLDRQVRRLRWEFMGGEVAQRAKANQYGTIKLLTDTDTDGDGNMDRAHVWADRLPPCYGVVPARGGVIVVCAPDIIFLADRDGDGVAEVRETLYTGFRISTLERGINNPRWGVDNWIYVGGGGGGGTIRGPKLKQPVQLGQTDFRIKADGSAIEPVHGAVGTYGLAINDMGDRFPCSGSRPAIYALPLPYRYLKRNPFVATPPTNYAAVDYSSGFRISQPHPWRVRRGQDPAWVKFYGKRETDSNYFTGGCGGEIYRDDVFPKAYHGNFFYCEPSLNIVHRCIIERDGAGYQGRRAENERQSEFLASTDQWFRPINLRVGPDGALYIVDMYREIIEDYSAIPRFLQQQYGVIRGNDRGRIWRLLPDSPAERPPANLTALDTDKLVEATAHASSWWRHTAQRLLTENDNRSAAPALTAILRSAATPAARVQILYTLQQLGQLSAGDIDRGLHDTSHAVRVHALRLVMPWLKTNRELLAATLSMVDDPDPAVRLQLAMTLGESPSTGSIGVLAQLARVHGHERWMSAAILSSARDSAAALLVDLMSEPQRASELLRPLASTVTGGRDGQQIASVLGALAEREEVVQLECLGGLIAGLPRDDDGMPPLPAVWSPLVDLVTTGSSPVQTQAVILGARLGFQQRPELHPFFSLAAKQAVDWRQSIAQRQRHSSCWPKRTMKHSRRLQPFCWTPASRPRCNWRRSKRWRRRPMHESAAPYCKTGKV